MRKDYDSRERAKRERLLSAFSDEAIKRFMDQEKEHWRWLIAQASSMFQKDQQSDQLSHPDTSAQQLDPEMQTND